MFIDTHCHLSNEEYDIDEVIKNANSEDVNILITGGTNKENNCSDILLSKKYKNVYITLGYHPEYASFITKKDLDDLEKQIVENKDKVVGIGEIGLDYHYGKENKEKQIELFKKQILLANKHHLPIVVHTRDATFDTINIIKELKPTGVIHCFSGSLEIAKEYINLGFKLGIGGVVTFKNSNLKNIISEIGIDNIVLETDSPYLSPKRGEKNEPRNIKLIFDFLCFLLPLDKNYIKNKLYDNSVKIFKFDKKN